MHRARVHSCVRKWKEAAEDYEAVLRICPSSQEATAGLSDLKNERGAVHYDLPMMNEVVVTNTQNPYV